MNAPFYFQKKTNYTPFVFILPSFVLLLCSTRDSFVSISSAGDWNNSNIECLLE